MPSAHRALRKNPLPVSTPDELRTTASVPPIFMVDDEETDRVLFRRRFAEVGAPYPLQQFRSGEDVIDAFISVLRGARAPLVCFLDIKMTDMSGFDVLRWIRCQHALDEVPVVMLSSSEEPLHFQEASYSGAQCYVAKFPPADQLAAILREAEAMVSSPRMFKLSSNLLLTAHPAAH